MKKYIVLVTVIVVISAGAYFYTHSNQAPLASQQCPTTYTSKEYNFSFECASNQSFDAFVPNSPTVGVWNVWIYDDNPNNNAAAFTIKVHPSDKALADFMAEERRDVAASPSGSYVMSEVKNTTLGGKEALMYDYKKSSIRTGSGNGSVYWVSNGNFTYRIGGNENPNSPNEFKDFLSSFAFSQ